MVEDAAQERHADPARWPDRPVPERQRLLPRLRRERRGGRLHDPDPRQRCPGLARPLVRRRPYERRGVHGRARSGHDGLQHGLVPERQRHAEAEVRAAAGARRSGPVGLGRSGARAARTRSAAPGAPAAPGATSSAAPAPATSSQRRRDAGLARHRARSPWRSGWSVSGCWRSVAVADGASDAP